MKLGRAKGKKEILIWKPGNQDWNWQIGRMLILATNMVALPGSVEIGTEGICG